MTPIIVNMPFQRLQTRQQLRLAYMARMYQQEKLKRLAMPYALRLAAITASDNRLGKEW